MLAAVGLRQPWLLLFVAPARILATECDCTTDQPPPFAELDVCSVKGDPVPHHPCLPSAGHLIAIIVPLCKPISPSPATLRSTSKPSMERSLTLWALAFSGSHRLMAHALAQTVMTWKCRRSCAARIAG